MRLRAFLLLTTLLALVSGCGKSDPNAADQTQLTGVWKVVKFDFGEEGKGPPKEIVEKMRIGFKGDKMYLYESAEEYEDPMLVAIDAKQSPKHITTTKLDEKGQPKKAIKEFDKDSKPVYEERKPDQGIYKFEGDKLVIAIAEGKNAERPKDFKAIPWKKPEAGKEPDFNQPTVAVLTLEKTTDAIPEFKPKPEMPKIAFPKDFPHEKPKDIPPPPVPAPPIPDEPKK